MTAWESTKLYFPIKIVNHATKDIYVELEDISEGPVDDVLFQFPAEYTQDQIQTFWDEMDKKLTEYGEKIDLLQAKADNLAGDAKKNVDHQLEAMRQEYGEISDKLDELKNSGSTGWEKLKSGISTAMDHPGNTFQKLEQELNKP
jgi:chromosome segregation ATPase